jgi:hypothetical protein
VFSFCGEGKIKFVDLFETMTPFVRFFLLL